MIDRRASDVDETLREASRAEDRTRAASRWYAGYMLAMGALAFALVVAIEVFFPDGAARGLATGVWALAVLGLARWAETHDVHPRQAGRRMLVAAVAWFASYLLLIGPLVRWKAGDSLGWWSLAAAVMAAPFLIGAWRQWRRS